jgi:hypothetical protein
MDPQALPLKLPPVVAIPAQAGIHACTCGAGVWIPARAGMTGFSALWISSR